MRTTLPLLLALLAAAVAAAPARADGVPGEEAGPAPAPARPPDLDDHPLFSSGSEDWMELRGGIEAGVRAVTGKEGRYDQDVNLDGGFRLLDARLEGNALEEGLWADHFSMRITGLGDPVRLATVAVRSDGAYDLRIHSDREETVFRDASDAHPFDSLRLSDGARLSFHVLKDLELHVSSERIRRSGDGLLDQRYPDYLSFPVAATVDYDGKFHSAGFDGSSGAFRFGGKWSWSAADDESFRVLDRADTPVRDLGRYRSASGIGTEAATGRAGLRLWRGAVDLEVLGSWNAAKTTTRIRGRDSYSIPTAPFSRDTEVRGLTESNARGWTGRADLLVRPREDWEVLGRYESRAQDRVGGGVEEVRPDAASPFIPTSFSTRGEAELRRTGLEARWRASSAWRFRAGAEEVRETVRELDRDLRVWRPTTVAGTAGADWTPNDRFDASLLVREARARDAATPVSADVGDSASLRLRAKRPDGHRLTAFARVKQRTNEDSDAVVSYDAYGLSYGYEGAEGWFEASVSREEYLFAADTRFVVDLSSPVYTPHRVRYDEAVTAATLDLSWKVVGPLRVFGRARWADGNGGAPYLQSDASLGIGWRFVKSTELRLEGRRIVYDESRRNVDDYAAKILTLSVAYEF